jgi:drug/metabolite transporter (DMT)-like permease
VLAIALGLVTACLWASTLLGSARASRLIGTWSALGWVMLIGLAVAVPIVLLTAPRVSFSNDTLVNLVLAGVSNPLGLLLVYTALLRGKVAVVGPIVSTEGAIGAVFAILAGDVVGAATMVLLVVIAVGVVLAAVERRDSEAPVANPVAPGTRPVSAVGTAALALGGAVLFGVNLYATSRLAAEVPLAWTILPARLAGFVGVTIPLLATRRLRLVRAAIPFVILVGVAEVIGIATYAIASTDSAPVASVIASQFAAIAAIAAFALFGERLTRTQTVGVVTIAVGVAALAAVQAG